jgi:hypothetical protein
MINRKEEASPVEQADYKPMYCNAGRNGSYTVDTDPSPVPHAERVYVDALFHYFMPDLDATEFANEDRDLSQEEALAKLIARKYHQSVYVNNTVARHEAPAWTHFRDEATFISGDIVEGKEWKVVDWLRMHHGDAMVAIDGSRYSDEHGKDDLIPAFDQLMQLANNQKDVIEEGVVRLYPTDSRAAMRFLNAGQYETIEDDAYDDTKWLAEGRILAHELVNIRSFQKNFNLLVIVGASRYIHANQLNLNNLYRLMAKLGRQNTRLVFLG